MFSKNASMYEVQRSLMLFGITATHHGVFLRTTREEIEKPWATKILADAGVFIEFQGPNVILYV